MCLKVLVTSHYSIGLDCINSTEVEIAPTSDAATQKLRQAGEQIHRHMQLHHPAHKSAGHHPPPKRLKQCMLVSTKFLRW